MFKFGKKADKQESQEEKYSLLDPINGAFMAAAKEGDFGVIKMTARDGANLFMTDKDGKTALHLAASTGSNESVRWLLEKGIDVSAKDKKGNVALFYACGRGHMDVVMELIAGGADPYEKCGNGVSPLVEASRRGNYSVVEYLVESVIDLTGDRRELHAAYLAAHGRTEARYDDDYDYDDARKCKKIMAFIETVMSRLGENLALDDTIDGEVVIEYEPPMMSF